MNHEFAGFSLHAGIGIEAHARGKLEPLCRYVSRAAVAEGRLTLTTQGDVRDRLKTPYRDGTTHIVLSPLDLLGRLAVLTTDRGVEALGSVWTFLDLTPLRRQELWEDSPNGWPQTPPYEGWRRHDEYRR